MKPTQGRPPRNGIASTVSIHIRCQKAEKQAIKALARAKRVSMSAHVLGAALGVKTLKGKSNE